jgi:5-carboxymethyl-2-hydroxymuconate isomerase
MPQINMNYSNDIKTIDFHKLFKDMEVTINEHDSTAGICKSRAYPTDIYHHTHIDISVLLIKKKHRDENFMRQLQEKLILVCKNHVPLNCLYSINLIFSGDYYFTTNP